MEESPEAFQAKLIAYSDEEILSILQSLDRERFPDRWRIVRDEARKRKAAGGMAASAPDPGSRYKTLWRRVGAGIFDGAVVFAAMFMGLKMAGLSLIDLTDATPFLRAAVSLPGILYHVLMHWKYGATWGKMVFGIRVVDVATEGPIRISQALMRDIVPILATFLPIPGWYLNGSIYRGLRMAADLANSLWAWAEIVSALFNAKRRAIHDFLADTVCIRV